MRKKRNKKERGKAKGIGRGDETEERAWAVRRLKGREGGVSRWRWK